MNKHSRRYIKILPRLLNISEKSDDRLSSFLKFFENSKVGNSEKVKISFVFNISKKNKNFSFKDFFSLPFSTTNRRKIIVLDEKISKEEREEFGDSLTSLEELRDIINKKNFRGIRKLISHSSTEDILKPYSKILSMKKIYPNKKEDTFSDDVLKSFITWSNGFEVKSDRDGNLNFAIGKISFSEQEIRSNIDYSLERINLFINKNRIKNSVSIKKIIISTIMGPGVELENN